jgi:hypothetical protein
VGDPDFEVVDKEDHRGAGEGSPDTDVDEPSGDPERD